MSKPNTIIAIGYSGNMKCYLNISREEALKRFNISDGPFDPSWHHISEFTFTDEFWAYAIDLVDVEIRSQLKPSPDKV